jgi:hypothetical protein
VGGRLIDFLVERRHVSRQRLLAGMRLQTYGLIEQLLRWDQGDFKFYTGEEVSYEEGFVPITVEELLLNAGDAAARDRRPPAPAAPPAPSSSSPAAASARPSRPPLRAVPPPEPLPTPPPPASARPPGVAPVRAAEPAPLRSPARPLSPVPPAQMPPLPPKPQSPAAYPAGEPPVPATFRKMKVEQVAVPRSFRAVARVVALVPAVLLVVFLLTDPGLLLLPFPWEEAQRQELAQEQRSSLYMKIDRAAKTFFLLEARFPERLAQLQQLDLLSEADLRDPQSHELRYSAREESYKVQPVDGKGTPIFRAETTDAVTGNFLLDSEFISVSPDAQAPLVLLD